MYFPLSETLQCVECFQCRLFIDLVLNLNPDSVWRIRKGYGPTERCYNKKGIRINIVYSCLRRCGIILKWRVKTIKTERE